MTRTELATAAETAGIVATAYSVDGGLPEDRHVLECVGASDWSVYFVERGRRIDEMRFETEAEACDELLLRLVRDPTTRLR